MQNFHLNQIRTIGLTMWVGNEIPRPNKLVLLNNANYFDVIYLVTNIEDIYVPDNVVKISFDEFKKYSNSMFKMDLDLHPAQWSDLLSYFGNNFLNSIDITINKLIYFDLDFLIYNKFLLKEIFNYNYRFLSLRDENLYVRYIGREVYNTGCTLQVDVNDPSIHEIYLLVSEVLLDKNNNRYTKIGPGLLNSDKATDLRDRFRTHPFNNIEPHSLNPVELYEGRIEIPLNKFSLGFHATFSIAKEIGYTIEVIKKRENKIILEVS